MLKSAKKFLKLGGLHYVTKKTRMLTLAKKFDFWVKVPKQEAPRAENLSPNGA